MTLKELLNYRNKCLICDTDMEMKSPDLAGVDMFVDAGGLKVVTGHKDISVYFKFDGTYEKMKKWNSLYAKPLFVMKECPICIPSIKIDGRKIKIKSRSVGITRTFSDYLSDFRYCYTFEIFGHDNCTFDAKLNNEYIKVNDGEKYYHITTDFNEKISDIYCGKIDYTSNSTIDMKVPIINTSTINDKEQLMNKIKLYNTFS